MGDRVLSNCLTPYCKNATHHLYCDECKSKKDFNSDKQIRKQNYKNTYSNKLFNKGLKNNFYSSRPWRNLRRWFLNGNPLCNICERIATQVDHIIPIMAGGQPLDADNLQSLCASCHSQKTAREKSR